MDQKTEEPYVLMDEEPHPHKRSIIAIVRSYEEKKSQVPKQYWCFGNNYKGLIKVLNSWQSGDIVVWHTCYMFMENSIKNSENTLLVKLLGEYWVSQSQSVYNPGTHIGQTFKKASELKIPDDVLSRFKSKAHVDIQPENTAASYTSVLSSFSGDMRCYAADI